MSRNIPQARHSIGLGLFVLATNTRPGVQAAKSIDPLLVPFLGVVFGLPAVLLCVVLCVVSSLLRKRSPRPWHGVYAIVAIVLSGLVGLGLPLAAWLYLPSTYAYDIVLFAFPIALAGSWSAWLALLLKWHAKGKS